MFGRHPFVRTEIVSFNNSRRCTSHHTIIGYILGSHGIRPNNTMTSYMNCADDCRMCSDSAAFTDQQFFAVAFAQHINALFQYRAFGIGVNMVMRGNVIVWSKQNGVFYNNISNDSISRSYIAVFADFEDLSREQIAIWPYLHPDA